MKREIITFAFLVSLGVWSARAIIYNEITITPSSNTLVQQRAGIGQLLPEGFSASVFDSEGNPTMDRLYLFMTLPAGMSDLEISEAVPRIVLTPKGESLNDGFDMATETPSVTFSAGDDVVFSFVKDGSGYVLSDIPFDPTTRAMDEVVVPDHTTQKVYIAGSTTGALSAELPERVTILMPAYLNSLKQSFSDIFVQYIHSMIGSQLPDFSFNPNCEGFFTFTGGQGSKVDIYTDNLSIRTKDKLTDFIGSVVASNATINLMGIDEPGNEENVTEYTNAELTAKSEGDIQAFDEDQIRSFSAEQLKIIATRMTAEQCSWITPGQVLALCDISDILIAMSQTEAIGQTLYGIFQDPDKAQNAGGALTTDNLFSAIGAQLQPLMGGNPMNMIGALFGGMDLMSMIGKIFGSMVEGTASPFAFKSNSDRTNSDAFEVKIHNK
ncbi:MAG: hypothetical protein IJV55_00855, partial [Paludibacteraceae bacterium]|nr:hypothetical protein [Paludibacteraceae bacterium]